MIRRRDWYQKKYWSAKIVALLTIMLALAGMIGVRILDRNETIWSWSIGNQVVLIDAGHGGVDPGAVGKNSLEKDITLAVAKRVKVLIQQAGGSPIMVRETDVDLGSSEGLLKRKREDLAKRIQLATEARANVYLSIHANSYPNPKLSGSQIFYHSTSPEGKVLAEMIQAETNRVAGTSRVAKGNQEFFILKKADQAAVTIELGFISNSMEESKLLNPDYQQQLAVAIYEGLTKYFMRQNSRNVNG